MGKYTATQIKNWDIDTETPSGGWIPARPLNPASIVTRCRHALGVLAGRYDVLDWEHGENITPLYTRPHSGEQGDGRVRCDERLPTEIHNKVDLGEIHLVLRKVWARDLSADDGLDEIERIVEGQSHE